MPGSQPINQSERLPLPSQEVSDREAERLAEKIVSVRGGPNSRAVMVVTAGHDHPWGRA